MTNVRQPKTPSDASRKRAELAERLAERCPPDLAEEIALVGSTARGLADEESDLELNFWGQNLPLLEARMAWLREAGASEIYPESSPRSDDPYWIHGSVGGISIEVGWQTFEAAEALIKAPTLSDRIVTDNALAERTEPMTEANLMRDWKVPVLFELITSAIALRTTGYLAGWKATLNQYSDELQRRVIEQAVGRWSKAGHIASMLRLARRGERLALTEALVDDLDQALHLLYAVKRRWEPSAKWMLAVAREFAPFDLDARIDAVLGDPVLERRVELCAQVCLEVLALVPEGYDVSAAVEALKRGLR